MLCGVVGADAQQHYVCCPVAPAEGQRWLHLAPLPTDASAIACIIMASGSGGMNAMRVAPWLDALATATHAGNHGAQSRPRGAVAACLKETVRRHPRCRRALAQAV